MLPVSAEVESDQICEICESVLLYCVDVTVCQFHLLQIEKVFGLELPVVQNAHLLVPHLKDLKNKKQNNVGILIYFNNSIIPLGFLSLEAGATWVWGSRGGGFLSTFRAQIDKRVATKLQPKTTNAAL